MIRVCVIVEGQTEETFVKEVLAPALYMREVYLFPVLLGPPGHRGGNVNYTRVRKDILVQLKQDRIAYCSTMFDFYGLGSGFPGTPLPQNLGSLEKVTRIEEAIKQDIVAEAPELRSDARFWPYLQLHEYEGLLFSDPAAFATGIAQPHTRVHFERVRGQFATPEDINDSPIGAPSKRVLDAYRGYRKPIDGVLAARSVGIERMRAECPHFHAWLLRLESFANAS